MKMASNMTDKTPSLRDAVKMALEALEYHQQQTRPISQTDVAIEFLRAALAVPEALPELEPVAEYLALPRTPADIREFIGSNANSMKFANAPKTGDDYRAFLNSEPSEDDAYSVSAHDLLSSFSEWEDFHGATDAAKPAPVERQPLTESDAEKAFNTWNLSGASKETDDFYRLNSGGKIERAFHDGLRACEAAHGIGTA